MRAGYSPVAHIEPNTSPKKDTSFSVNISVGGCAWHLEKTKGISIKVASIIINGLAA